MREPRGWSCIYRLVKTRSAHEVWTRKPRWLGGVLLWSALTPLTGCFTDFVGAGSDESSGSSSGAEMASSTGSTGSSSVGGGGGTGTTGSVETGEDTTGGGGGSTEDGTTSSEGTSSGGAALTSESGDETTTGEAGWHEGCRWNAPAPTACPAQELLGLPAHCDMPLLQVDGSALCERGAVSAIQLVLPAGDYVVAAPQQLDAEISAVTTLGTAVTCAGNLAEVAVSDPAAAGIGVRSNAAAGTATSVMIRSRAELCPIADMGCCEASAAQASEACGDIGLRDCVVEVDPVCDGSWDQICVAEATLQCGAACL